MLGTGALYGNQWDFARQRQAMPDLKGHPSYEIVLERARKDAWTLASLWQRTPAAGAQRLVSTGAGVNKALISGMGCICHVRGVWRVRHAVRCALEHASCARSVAERLICHELEGVSLALHGARAPQITHPRELRIHAQVRLALLRVVCEAYIARMERCFVTS